MCRSCRTGSGCQSERGTRAPGRCRRASAGNAMSLASNPPSVASTAKATIVSLGCPGMVALKIPSPANASPAGAGVIHRHRRQCWWMGRFGIAARRNRAPSGSDTRAVTTIGLVRRGHDGRVRHFGDGRTGVGDARGCWARRACRDWWERSCGRWLRGKLPRRRSRISGQPRSQRTFARMVAVCPQRARW